MTSQTVTTITAESTHLTFDNDELMGYNIFPADAGKYAVIQLGYACLGVGETPEAAVAEANSAMTQSEDAPLTTSGIGDGRNDGDIVIVLIEAE
jgi:hypothetical protein